MLSVEWCSVCNSRPSDGKLTIVIENGEQVDIPACLPCVYDKTKVEFVE